jgi:hypothetical protein
LRTLTLVPLLSCIALGACGLSGEPAPMPEEDWKERCSRTDGEPLPRECPKETRPVTSGVAAACIAAKVVPPDDTPDCEWRYSVTFRNSRWIVSIFDSSITVRDGGYLIHVDPKSGRILKIDPQQ